MTVARDIDQINLPPMVTWIPRQQQQPLRQLPRQLPPPAGMGGPVVHHERALMGSRDLQVVPLQVPDAANLGQLGQLDLSSLAQLDPATLQALNLQAMQVCS